MAANDLTSIDNASAWLGSSSGEQALVERLITAVSTQIQNFLGYQIAQATYTRTFNGPGGCRLLLPDRPVTAVSAVTIDGVSIPAAAGQGPGYLSDDKVLYLRGYSFCRGVQNVTVAYTAGYAATPGDIEQACLDWLNAAYSSQDRDPTITSREAGGTKESYGGGVAALSSIKLLMPSSVAAVLLPYRRVSM